LENSFSSSDVSNKKEIIEEESKREIGNTIPVNIGTQEDPNIPKIGAQCSEQEKQKFMDIFHEFRDVFAWSYEYLRGFDPSIIHHAIPIKEEEKPVIQRQRPLNPTLEAIIRKEVGKFLNAHIIFLVKYS
jgi:hypothetical protein